MAKARAELERGGEPAVLGAGVRVRGHVRGDGDLCIEGDVEGDVAVSGGLDLGEQARVVGKLAARGVKIAGKLEGDVKSDGPVALGAGAQVRGDVTASGFSMEEGARFDGLVEVDFELPDGLE
jgi:cytoskeletal protein CcmA (bactofilin family)